jgi:hypothetical protein
LALVSFIGVSQSVRGAARIAGVLAILLFRIKRSGQMVALWCIALDSFAHASKSQCSGREGDCTPVIGE